MADGFRVSMLIAFSDPKNARLIYLAAAGLVLLGVGLTWLTVRWWRASEQLHPALEPLVVMGTMRWRKSGSTQRALALDDARPDGAERILTVPDEEPLAHEDGRAIDEMADEFEDLREPDAEHVGDIAGRSEASDAVPIEPAPAEPAPAEPAG